MIPVSDQQPETVICRYQVRPGREAELEKLLARHWLTLHAAGLVTDERPRIFRGLPSETPGAAGPAACLYVEIFTWKDAQGSSLAHQLPEVMAIWEPMGALCDSMEFPHFRPLDLVPADG